MQCVAVRCRVLQCVAVYCNSQGSACMQHLHDILGPCVAVCGSVLQCVAAVKGCALLETLARHRWHRCCSVLQCCAEWCSVLQCVAVCCSVLQCVAAVTGSAQRDTCTTFLEPVMQWVAVSNWCIVVCCRVLHCVVLCCSVLQRAAVCSSALQFISVCCSVLQCVAVRQ